MLVKPAKNGRSVTLLIVLVLFYFLVIANKLQLEIVATVVVDMPQRLHFFADKPVFFVKALFTMRIPLGFVEPAYHFRYAKTALFMHVLIEAA